MKSTRPSAVVAIRIVRNSPRSSTCSAKPSSATSRSCGTSSSFRRSARTPYTDFSISACYTLLLSKTRSGLFRAPASPTASSWQGRWWLVSHRPRSGARWVEDVRPASDEPLQSQLMQIRASQNFNGSEHLKQSFGIWSVAGDISRQLARVELKDSTQPDWRRSVGGIPRRRFSRRTRRAPGWNSVS